MLEPELQRIIRSYHQQEPERSICYLSIDRNTRDTMELTICAGTTLRAVDEYLPSHYAWIGRQLVLVSSGVERMGTVDTTQLSRFRAVASLYLYGRRRHQALDDEINYNPPIWQLRKTGNTGRYAIFKGALKWNTRHLQSIPPAPPRL
ncbi:hypothetical protein [Hymenobacter sp. B81]|uniref:hypothetical protein n=1 Tax=Hymenobacter sp. B81 TaxID=3344878 RepID=UPI0037DC9C04